MAYNIQLNNITAGTDNLISSISLKITDDKTPVADVTDLQNNNFEISSNITLTTAATVTNMGAGNYTITFATQPNITTDYVVIKLVPGAPAAMTNTDVVKLFVDPAEIFTDGKATFNNFNVKTPGQYVFVLDQVDLQKVNRTSDPYNFVNPADKAKSSISILNQNPNQAIVIPDAAGANVSLEVTLSDGTKAITGVNSVSIYSNPLFDVKPSV